MAVNKFLLFFFIKLKSSNKDVRCPWTASTILSTTVDELTDLTEVAVVAARSMSIGIDFQQDRYHAIPHMAYLIIFRVNYYQ